MMYILSFLVGMVLPAGDSVIVFGRFGDSTWVLNVEAEVVETAVVLSSPFKRLKGRPPARWMVDFRGNPIRMDENWGEPLFQETTI